MYVVSPKFLQKLVHIRSAEAWVRAEVQVAQVAHVVEAGCQRSHGGRVKSEREVCLASTVHSDSRGNPALGQLFLFTLQFFFPFRSLLFEKGELLYLVKTLTKFYLNV